MNVDINRANERLLLLQRYIESVRMEIGIIESGCTPQMLESFASYPVLPGCSDLYVNNLQFPPRPQLVAYLPEVSSSNGPDTVTKGDTQEYFTVEPDSVDDNADGQPRRRGRSYSSASSKSNKHSDNEGDNNEASLDATTTRNSEANAIKYTYGKNSKKAPDTPTDSDDWAKDDPGLRSTPSNPKRSKRLQSK